MRISGNCLVILLVVAALFPPPASALKVLLTDEVYDVKALTKIEAEKGKKTLYHYSLNNSDKELVLETPLTVTDARPLKEQKPKVYWGRRVWRWIQRAGQGANIVGAFRGLIGG